MPPVIGITPSPTDDVMPHGTFRRHAINANYVQAVIAAGGVPVVLPPQPGAHLELLNFIDGLLLTGGADLDPRRYGVAERHPTTYGVDAERDAFELGLTAGALLRDLPIFAICRGIQLLNVALGGSLIQDVGTELQSPDPINHRQHENELPPDAIGHRVAISADSPLARIVGTTDLGVNSFHHQAIADIAPDLALAAVAPDGVIEAVFHPNRTFVLAVQWHPELMYERHPEQGLGFSALVHAAAEHRMVAATA